MRFVALLLLLAGWSIVLAALALLPSPAARTGFVLAGVGVELLGLVLLAHAHRVLGGEEQG